MDLEFEFDDEDVQKLIKGLPLKVVSPSVVRATNLGIRKGVTQGYKSMSRVSGIKQKYLKRKRGQWGGRISRQGLTTRRFMKSATGHIAKVFFRTKSPVPISRTVKGLKSEEQALRRIAKRTSYITPNPTFFARMNTKFTLWYRRTSERGSVQEVSIPISTQATNSARQAVIKTFYPTYEKELQRQIKLQLKKIGRL